MRKTLYYALLILILAFLIALPNAFAVVKQFTSTDANNSETYIRNCNTCENLNFGASNTFNVARNIGGEDWTDRALINFSWVLGSLGVNSIMNEVTFQVEVGGICDSTETVYLYPIIQDWDVNAVTWNSIGSTDGFLLSASPFKTGGGANGTFYDGETVIGSGFCSATSGNMNFSMDEAWLQDQFENPTDAGAGTFIMKHKNSFENGTSNDRRRWWAQEYSLVVSPPALFVDFTPGTDVNFSFEPPTPANNTKDNVQIEINATCLAGSVDLYLDQNSEPTTPIVTSGGDHYVYTTNFNTSGLYYYRGSCNGGTTLSPVEQYFYDGFQPGITLNGGNAFTELNVTVDRYAELRTFNLTLEDETDLFGFLFNISLGGATVYSYINETLGGTLFNWTQTINVSAYTPAVYSVDIWASDSHTKEEICPFNDANCYKPKKKASELEFDTPEGINVRVVTKEASLVDTEKLQDRQTFEFNWTDGKTKKRVIDLYSDAPLWYVGWRTGIPGHFVTVLGVDGNWIDFAGSGLTFTDVTVKKITDYHYEVTIEKAVNKQKFESIGGLNTNHENYALIVADLTSDVKVTPAQPTKFSNLIGQCIGNETGGDDVQFEWTWYNGTSIFNQTIFNDSINYTEGVFANLNTVQSNTLSVGDNWTFSCHARSFGVESSWKNFSVGTVLDTLVGNCSVALPYPVLNMSYYDEISDQPITVDNGVAFFFDDGQLTRNFTANFAGNFHDAVCTNLDPSILPYEWDMWGDILALEKDGYATRTFNIPFSEAITVNNTNPYQLELQLIPLNQSTTVQYTWLTTSYQPISGTMRVYRCNIDATETLTDSLPIIQGSVAANIELLNTLYRYEVIIDGILYADTTSYSLCHTETLTERQFFVDVTPLEMDQKLGMYDILCSVEETSPNVVQMNWSANPGSSLPITGCLEAYRYGISGWNKYYEDCESTAFSIQRTIPENGNDYQVRGRLYQAGLAVGCKDIVTVASNKAGQQFGATALLAIVFLIIALSLIWSGKGQGAIVGAAVAVAASWFLGITNLPWLAVSTIISFLVIIAWIARANTRS